MSSTLITKLRIGDWSESLNEEFGDGSKITGAEVPLQDGTDGLESGWFSMLSYYRPDGTSEFTTMLRLAGQLDGRTGTFILRGEGTFDGTSFTGSMRIVDRSGTGELAWISGTGDLAGISGTYMPLSLAYELT